MSLRGSPVRADSVRCFLAVPYCPSYFSSYEAPYTHHCCTRSDRVWLVKPRGGLSTPLVFRNMEYDRLSTKDPEELLKKFLDQGVFAAEYVNDLELPAFKVMPALLQMKTELQVSV